jgi:hypothetical protein
MCLEILHYEKTQIYDKILTEEIRKPFELQGAPSRLSISFHTHIEIPQLNKLLRR